MVVLEKFPAEKVTGILEWVFGEMMMGEEEHRGGRVFGEFRDVFKSAKSENVRGSDGVEIEIEEND